MVVLTLSPNIIFQPLLLEVVKVAKPPSPKNMRLVSCCFFKMTLPSPL
jgi:hypothetical protein